MFAEFLAVDAGYVYDTYIGGAHDIAAQRRAKGDGSLFKRPLKAGGHVWIGKLQINGRAVMRSLGPVRSKLHPDGLTPASAQDKLGQLRGALLDEGAKPERAKASHTLRDAADGLLSAKRAAGRKPTTLESIESSVRMHIVPFFPEPVSRITEERVQSFQNALLEDKGLAPKSVRNCMGILHGLFEYAVRRKWAVENPVKRIEKPRSTKPVDFNFLSPEELEALLRAVPETPIGRVDRVMYLCAAMSGLRQGELLALRWSDVNWLDGKVHVRRNFVRGEYQSPKSGKGRSVPLTPRVLRELEALHRASRFQAEDDLVFAHPETGAPMDRSKLLKRFKAAVTEARVGRFEPVLDEIGQPRTRPVVDPRTNRWVRDEQGVPVTVPMERALLRFHDLRHTFGTQLAREGIAMRKIQEFMGHADFATTLIYSHFSPSPGDADQIAAAFGEEPLSVPEPGAPAGMTVADQIRSLADLHSAGILSDDEFSDAKGRLLAAL